MRSIHRGNASVSFARKLPTHSDVLIVLKRAIQTKQPTNRSSTMSLVCARPASIPEGTQTISFGSGLRMIHRVTVLLDTTGEPTFMGSLLHRLQSSPFAALDHFTLGHIFSFLAPCNNNDISLCEAAQFCHSLSSVCRAWKDALEEHLCWLVGRLNLKRKRGPTTCCPDDEIFRLQWMHRHRIRLGSALQLPRVDIVDPACAKHYATNLMNVLKHCDTSRLKYINGDIRHGSPCQQHDLYNTIVSECPRLKSMSIKCFVSSQNNYVGDLRILSKLPIRSLKLRLCDIVTHQSSPRDAYIFQTYFSDLISKLEALVVLEIAGPTGDFGKDSCMTIRSESLRYLHIVDLTENFFVRCHCPKLKDFRFSMPSSKGNGPIPSATPMVRKQLMGKWSHTVEVTAGHTRIPGVFIPPDCFCLMSISDYGETSTREFLGRYRNRFETVSLVAGLTD